MAKKGHYSGTEYDFACVFFEVRYFFAFMEIKKEERKTKNEMRQTKLPMRARHFGHVVEEVAPKTDLFLRRRPNFPMKMRIYEEL